MDTNQYCIFNHFERVYHFLMQYYPIWEKEVLNYYPESYENFPREWINQVKSLGEKDRWMIDSKRSFDSLGDCELKTLFETLQSIVKLPESPKPKQSVALAPKEKTGLKIKKQHEVEVLLNFLQKEKDEDQSTNFPKSFIDIGGGKGHLSRLLSQKLNMPGTCIEMNEDFIKRGKKLLTNQAVNFKHSELLFDDEIANSKILKEASKSDNDLCIGLHTCGPLANSIIKASALNKQNYILNFGCCYLKLKPGKKVGISSHSSKFSLPLSKYALTLATRAHTGLTWQDYLLKRKVKSYRYGIHLYLYHVIGIKQFINVGDGSKADYQNNFYEYALKKLEHLKITTKQTSSEIQQWWEQPSIQQKIDEMYCMNIIRWQFGRAIEMWILLDRACYLEEKGYEIKMEEYFNEKISPRNIGIFASKLPNEQHL